MAFISGVQVIDAPASALNNAGKNPSSSVENAVAVKSLRVGNSRFPYVSAQAYRHWLRRTLEALGEKDWPTAPVFREEKVAYTDANPILYADDDLFGYMRAEGTKKTAADSRAERKGETPMEIRGKKKVTVTRVSPLRIGTLVGLSDGIPADFGTMSRHEGDPVPHEHQFYRTSLKGMFSLDLGSAGVFSYEDRTGNKNLDAVRIALAQEKGLEPDDARKSYRLSIEDRIRRVTTLLRAMPVVTGGAKMGLHYTDVSPAAAIFAVTSGGNNPFQYLLDGDREGRANPDLQAFREVADVWGNTILSPLYIGWVRGYARDHHRTLEEHREELHELFPHGVRLAHPKRVFEELADALAQHPEWLNQGAAHV
jgi:CRISPR-associated protein Cst2